MPSRKPCGVCAAPWGDPCRIDGECARDVPVLDDYFTAMEDLSRLVRKALDYKGSVTRGEIRKALTRYERLREAAKL